MKEKISIKEIAKMTNVSVATVSRVINNNGRFSEETRQKVLKAIKDTGYQQNRLAVGLRSNRSNMIGILVPDITNEFYSSIVKKCEQALAEKGYSCIVCNTDRSPDKESNYLQSLSEHMVDGLIVISTYNSSKDYLKLNIPVVYIDRNPTTNSKIIITSDHYDGAKTATQYLIDTGFSPYIFTTKTKASATQERVKGFFDTLEKNQLDIDNRILRLNLTSNEFLRGSSDAKTFLDNIADKKIGIFAINDNVAYIALQTAQELGLKVPEKVSIIGFDDVPISRITRPQISSIHQNTDVISEQAANLMVEQLDSPNNKLNVTKIIQTNLILRGTTVQP